MSVSAGRQSASNFPWPRVPSSERAPRWTGVGFELDGKSVPWLSYVVEPSGWSDELTIMHETEAGDDHPIDVASRGRALTELRRRFRVDGVLVDVGCSSGWMLREVRIQFPRALAIGGDYVSGPLRRIAATDPSQPLVQFDLTNAPFEDGCLDAIVALNVLEHIEDDRRAVREMYRMLKPGGVAVIELPCGPHLYDVYDQALMHHRRYSRKQATELFSGVGFEIERVTHIGFFIYAPFVAMKLRNRRHMKKGAAEQKSIAASLIRQTKASRTMAWLMELETKLSTVVRYPLGVRLAFTAVKS